MEDQLIFIPSSEREALQWLIPALDAPVHDMLPPDFNRVWHAIQYLYMGLNPDEASDHGTEVSYDPSQGPERFMLIEPRLVAPYYVQSGWPLVLIPIVTEARLRSEEGIMSDAELYNLAALHAGHLDRSSGKTGLDFISLKS